MDHALTNREDYYHQSGTIDLGQSDHALIYIARKCKKIQRIIARIACRNYRCFDEASFQAYVENLDWSEVLDSNNASVAALSFQNLFLSACNLLAPTKMINFKENAPAWMKVDYLVHVDERKFISKNCRKSPCDENFALRDQAVQHTKALAESLQRSFFHDTLHNHAGDMKKTWQAIKRFWLYLNKKEPPFMGTESDLKHVADNFNQIFSEVGSSLESNIPDENIDPLAELQPHPPVLLTT